MLAVIDESGDPGFSIGSSAYFVVTMLIFDAILDAERTAKSVMKIKQKMRIRRELKFNSSSDRMRTEFFQAMVGEPFRIRSIIINKQSINDHEMRKHPKKFIFCALRNLIADDAFARASGAMIKIDRCGDRAVRDALSTYLRQHLPQGAIKSVKFVDSTHDLLIQLADMVVGAMARQYNASKSKTPTLWREMLDAHIDLEVRM